MPLLPFTRVLVSSDILANAITLIIFALGVLRLQTNLPLDESRNVYLGPKHAATHVCSVFLAYVVTSIGPLVLLRFNPHLYFKHRVPIVVAVRLMRLVVLQLTLNSHPMAAPIARISVARALESPSKGLIILVTQPMAFFMHHSMYLLPWRIAVLFQLATTAVLLRWYAWFPCFVGQALGSSTSHPWQNTASQACGSLQSYAALARAGLGAPLTEFSATLCDGPSALAVLQTFWTLVCLFVVPIALTHELERWMKLRYQQYLEDAGSSAASGGSGSSSSSSHSSRTFSDSAPIAGSYFVGSSSSSSVSSSSRLGGNLHGAVLGGVGGFQRPGRSIHTLSVIELQDMTEPLTEAASVLGHAGMLLLVLLLVLPLSWLLAEGLTEAFQASRDCSAVVW
jgi:hypothetical protein